MHHLVEYFPYIPYFFAVALVVIIGIAILGIVLIRRGRRPGHELSGTRDIAGKEAPAETAISKPADGPPFHAEKDADESRQE
jgi:hypothetical protein